MNILHIAPQNIAGVPWAFVLAERALGHTSRLITLARDSRGYVEDICLDLPLFHPPGMGMVKRLLSDPRRLHVVHRPEPPAERPPVWRPGSRLETLALRLRDLLWNRRVQRALNILPLDQFDVLQLDGGLGLLRDGRYVRALRARGVQCIVMYLGSDLRTRGILPHIDALADVRATVEFDLLDYYPGILYVPAPFDASAIAPARPPADGPVRIGHAPSVRSAKGSAQILAALERVAAQRLVTPVLIEGLPHDQAMALKASCHLFIDQVGSLGYGVNSMESCAMGIPTCTGLAAGFAEKFPDHPFIVVDETTLESRLLAVIDDPEFRRMKGAHGAAWVREFHNPRRVVQALHAHLEEATGQ